MLRPRTQGALRQSLFTSVFSPVFSSVFGGAGAAPTPVDAYAIGGASPELVAAFLTQADGTTEGEYFRTGGSDTDFSMFTFSRSGTATYFDSNGILQTAADGVARRNAYYYDSGWTKGGLQLERAAATNLETYSNDIENQWAQGRCVATNGNLALPVQSGGLASVVDDNSGGTTNSLFVGSNNYTVATSTRYVFSFFAKKGTIDWLAIRPVNFGVADDYTFVDLTNGSVGTTGTGHTGGIHEVAPDVFLCWVSFVTDASDTVGLFRVYAAADDNDRVVPNGGTSTFSIGHFQFETGSVPTSRIPTTGSTVTRAAETLSVAGADTPANTTAISISMKGLVTYTDNNSASEKTFLRWYGDASNRFLWYLYTNGGTGGPYTIQVAAGTSDIVLGGGSSIAAGVNSPFNIAARHTSGALNVAINGTAATANTTPTALADLSSTTLQVGQNFGGFISEFRMWGTDIGDSGIAEVTS